MIRLFRRAGSQDTRVVLPADKFEQRAPGPQNAIDIFAGRWAADLSPLHPGARAGTAPLFDGDTRLGQLADAFGSGGRLDGLAILELGPLEGGHAYQLERLGAARIVAIESNVEAYLKCLVTKEIAGLRTAHFELGDFLPYLEATGDRYDIVLCSGVLYHMSDPIRLIRAIARVTDRCFVWTHYYDAAHYPGAPRQAVADPAYPGIEMYALHHRDRGSGTFWGGNKPVTCWLKRQDILDSFAAAGLGRLAVVDESPGHPNGACITFTAQRR